MSKLELQESGSYLGFGQYTIDTVKHYDDHTFFGIMFDIMIKAQVPLHQLRLTAVGIRGMLGQVNIYFSHEPYTTAFNNPSKWKNVYEGFEGPSMKQLKIINLRESVKLTPGSRIALYIHCARFDDQGLVYDNQRSGVRHEDDFLSILPGIAHIAPTPFSDESFGFWAWRPHRQFVGSLSYDVQYKLWRPVKSLHTEFPPSFRRGVFVLSLCASRAESNLNRIPRDLLFYIINMMPYSWFTDSNIGSIERSQLLGASSTADGYRSMLWSGSSLFWNSISNQGQEANGWLNSHRFTEERRIFLAIMVFVGVLWVI